MAKKVDLSKYTLADLTALQKNVEKALADHQVRARGEALKEMQAVAKKHGLSVDDIVGRKGKKGAKAPAPAKYRNPENAEQTWSGRGRQPAWFKAALKKGKKEKTMEI